MTPRISPARNSSRRGFTLPEVLVALAILAVVVTALVRVHVGTLRTAAMARGMDEAVTQLENVAALSLLGTADGAIVEALAEDGWTATVEGRPGAGDGGMWKVWSVASSNRPAPVLKLYVRDTATAKAGEGIRREDGK